MWENEKYLKLSIRSQLILVAFNSSLFFNRKQLKNFQTKAGTHGIMPPSPPPLCTPLLGKVFWEEFHWGLFIVLVQGGLQPLWRLHCIPCRFESLFIDDFCMLTSKTIKKHVTKFCQVSPQNVGNFASDYKSDDGKSLGVRLALKSWRVSAFNHSQFITLWTISRKLNLYYLIFWDEYQTQYKTPPLPIIPTLMSTQSLVLLRLVWDKNALLFIKRLQDDKVRLLVVHMQGSS